MNDREWIARFAESIGAEPPSDEEVETLLGLAATAAHASERKAAPIACYLAGRSARPLDELNAAAEQIAPADAG